MGTCRKVRDGVKKRHPAPSPIERSQQGKTPPHRYSENFAIIKQHRKEEDEDFIKMMEEEFLDQFR